MGCSSSTSATHSSTKPRISLDFATDFFDHYYLDRKIVQGKFAQVRSLASLSSSKPALDATYTSNKSNIGYSGRCAKIFNLRDSRQPEKMCLEKLDLVAEEVQAWKRVGHHPNCAEIDDVYIYANICFVVMETCCKSLYHHMRHMSDLTEASLGKIVRQMLAALLHLHSFRLVHRDVHPDIFLVGGALGDTVKLCDFGCATFLIEGRKLCKPAGTYAFMSPQMLKGEEYDEKTDLWSLGVTVYAFLFGAFPYDFNGVDISKIQIVTTCNPPKFEVAGEMKESRSSDASNFVRALLQSDVEHRPSASEALHLPYMTMVVTSCDNENGVALPSLRPMLHLAREAGAIASLSLSRTTALDELVSIVQFDKLGVRMPDSWKKHQRSMATESYGKTLFESPDWADSVQVAKAWGPALGKGWGKKLSKTFSSTLLK